MICAYCGREIKDVTKEHIIPKSIAHFEGKNEIGLNCVYACYWCNIWKRAYILTMQFVDKIICSEQQKTFVKRELRLLALTGYETMITSAYIHYLRWGKEGVPYENFTVSVSQYINNNQEENLMPVIESIE